MFSIIDKHFYTYICLIEMLITEKNPSHIKIEYSFFKKINIVFFRGQVEIFPWSYNEL